MKAIINNKRYNTDTAEKVAEYSNGLCYSDFNHMRETLYRTSKGSWFLHGGGGPMTKYANRTESGTSGDEKIIPFTHGEALEWMEKHGFIDEIETFFPDKITDA